MQCCHCVKIITNKSYLMLWARFRHHHNQTLEAINDYQKYQQIFSIKFTLGSNKKRQRCVCVYSKNHRRDGWGTDTDRAAVDSAYIYTREKKKNTTIVWLTQTNTGHFVNKLEYNWTHCVRIIWVCVCVWIFFMILCNACTQTRPCAYHSRFINFKYMLHKHKKNK